VIPTARGAAARLLEEAEAYRQKTIAKSQGEAGRFNELLVEYEKSPDIMRRRLYIDTLESIFEKTNTVLIDVKNGNNVIYLPIDKQSYSTIRPMVAKEPEYTREQGDASESVIRNSRPSNRGRESRLP
jgi:membrane protease subunit HflK